MFKVNSTCGRNSSQSWRGQSLINSGGGSNPVFFESGNSAFGGIGLMVVQGDKLDID